MMQGWLVASALVGCLLGRGVRRLAERPLRTQEGAAVGRGPVRGHVAGLHPGADLGLLIAARLIGGLGVGIASMVVPLYIAEISPAHLRGRMVSCYQFAITIGVLAAYLSNAGLLELSQRWHDSQGLAPWVQWMFVDEVWRGMLGTLLVPAGAFFVLLFLVPESPRWLTKQGRGDAAETILARIGGRGEARRQMDEIRQTIAHESGDLRQLLHPGMRWALAVAVFLACAGQLSGINAIAYFGPKIMEGAGFKISDALGGQAILGTVNVAFTLLAMWKMDTMGRRPLLAMGTLGVFTSLVLIGAFFMSGVTSGDWLVVFMSTYIASFAFSLGPIPWVVMSEIFPTRIRGQAMSIATLLLWLTNTVVCQTFPWLNKHMGSTFTFWMFALLVSPVFLFVWRWMPETKGRTLEELEALFEQSGR